MKKLLALLLAVLMVASFAACSSGGGSGDKGSTKGEISVFYYTFSDAYISTVRSSMDKILSDSGYTYNDYDANGNQTTQTEQVQIRPVDDEKSHASTSRICCAVCSGAPLLSMTASAKRAYSGALRA